MRHIQVLLKPYACNPAHACVPASEREETMERLYLNGLWNQSDNDILIHTLKSYHIVISIKHNS